MRSRWLGFFLLSLPLLAGCGKNLDQQLKETIRNLDNAQLKKQDVEILDVQQNGDLAIAEVKIQTAFKLRKQGDQWHLEEIRLGDRRWEQAEIILQALDNQRVNNTRRQLQEIRQAIEGYRTELGSLPEAEDFNQLIDVLNPRFLKEIIRLDGWSRSFHFERLSAQQYDLRSAGSDGQLRTPDDVVPGENSK